MTSNSYDFSQLCGLSVVYHNPRQVIEPLVPMHQEHAEENLGNHKFLVIGNKVKFLQRSPQMLKLIYDLIKCENAAAGIEYSIIGLARRRADRRDRVQRRLYGHDRLRQGPGLFSSRGVAGVRARC